MNGNSPAPGDVASPVAVIGGGLAGYTAALSLARNGWKVLLFAPRPQMADGRTTALMADSIRFIKELGLWSELEARAYPLRVMRIIDDTGRLVRAPQTDFRSAEIGLEAFGYNFLNADFLEIAERHVDASPSIARIPDAVETIEPSDSGYRLTTSAGSQECCFLVGADGRNSLVRQTLGVGKRDWRYPQVALVGNLTHALPHQDISTEFHTPTGPTTIVPLGQLRSSLVCVVDPATADRLLALAPEELNLEIERRTHSVLGKVRMITALQSFPLSGMIATSFGTGRAVLVGEAAHVFPPIGAQGFNLGIRDVESVSKLLGSAASLDSAAPAYNRERIADVGSRTAAVDLLNRSLLSGFLPAQVARSFGLAAIGSIPPLRRLFMREGVRPGSSLRALFERRQAG